MFRDGVERSIEYHAGDIRILGRDEIFLLESRMLQSGTEDGLLRGFRRAMDIHPELVDKNEG